MDRIYYQNLLKDNEISSNQNIDEIVLFMKSVEYLLPNRNVIVEIGVEWGGTSALLSTLLTPPATIIGIDCNSTIASVNLPKIRMIADPSDYILIPHATTIPDIANKTNEILSGRKIDVLFIDGDHRYEIAKHDFLTFLPLMNSPSIIGFHDINQYTDTTVWRGHEMVGKYWRELVSVNSRCMEIRVGGNSNVYGIGLLLL